MKKRLHFDFGPEAIAKMDDLREATGLKNYAELIGGGLKALLWFAERHAKGDKVMVELDGVLHELQLPVEFVNP